MKKILLSSIVAISILGTHSFALEANATTKSVSKNAVTVAKTKANKQKSDLKVVKEAVESINYVVKTIASIDAKKKDEAIKNLEKAIGKIEVTLSDPKAPALLPIDGKVIVSQFVGTAYDVENAVITAEALLAKKRVQDARNIMLRLVDEVDFITVNLPLATYPNALKLAAKKLKEEKFQDAKAILVETLNTFVNAKAVTPIGILVAQDLIKAASKIAKDNKKLALSHLAEAKIALKKSEALGYVSTSDTTYKMLNDEISKIEKEVKGKNKAEKLFEDLISKLKEFKQKALKIVNK